MECRREAKASVKFDHEIGNIVFVLNAIDAGRLDHLFVDAETKAAVRADWMAKGEAVVGKYVRAHSGTTVRTWHRWSKTRTRGDAANRSQTVDCRRRERLPRS